MPSPYFLIRILTTLLGTGVMFISTMAVAAPRATKDLPEPYRIPTTNPQNIDAIKDVVGKGSSSRDGEIHQDLSERAVCGGWDFNESVNGKIPVVIGVPGRTGNPLGNPPSGMAVRDETSGALKDGYNFPRTDQVRGWSTACKPGFPPYFLDNPTCKKLNLVGTYPEYCSAVCPRINAWQFPVWVRGWMFPLPPPSLPLFKYCVQHGKGEKGRNNDPQNGDCCERLGGGDGGPNCAGKYASDKNNPTYDPYPGKMPPDAECLAEGAALEAAGWIRIYHVFAGWYYCCTGAIVSELDYDNCKLDDPAACLAHRDARRNCVRCEGDGLPVNHAYDECMENTSDEAYCRALHPPSNLGNCMTDADCSAPHKCLGSHPAQVFNIPCINDADCAAAGNNGVCSSSKCTYLAKGGNCFVLNGFPTVDENGEIVERGSDPMRQETGCRAGYGASTAINSSSGNSSTTTTNASGKKMMVPGQFISFFREYIAAGYSRAGVSKIPSDIRSRQGIPVACFGFYNEFDPKTRATSMMNSQCVIGAFAESNEFRRFYETQRGHGDFGQNQTFPDPDPTNAKEIRNSEFVSSEDLWYPNLGGGFSLLNGSVFKEKQQQDMTFALLSLDKTLERARGPMLKQRSAGSASTGGGSSGASSLGRGPDPYISLRSPGALHRAFDDTVSKERGTQRTIAEWWQQQETEAQELIHPAVAHIIFPSIWSANMDLSHFFPSPSLPTVSSLSSFASSFSPASAGSYDPRRWAMEIQVEVYDGLLGEVAAFLEQVLVAPVQERPVALVVPFGSATDFRAYKESWIRWKKLREDAGGVIPTTVQPLIDRLEEYAVQIDQARSLRSELAKNLGAALERQGQANKAIHDWLKANLDSFRSFQQQRQQREQILYEWRNLQGIYRDFHDKTNMPWCKNDAFTTSIYSLLDPWMTGRSDLSGLSLPRFQVDRPEDVFIDLTALQATEAPLLIPVLKPVQILVSHDNLQAPFVYQENVTVPTLPPLPALPKFSASGAKLPAFSAASGIVVTFPDVSPPPDAQNALALMRGVIEGMDRKYKKFWDAITKPRCGTLEANKRCQGSDPSTGECCVTGNPLYCKGWDQDTCVHVEMDLLERFTRIGARPAVLLKEDFDVRGIWRSAGTGTSSDFPPCDPKDWACIDLHKTKTLPRYGWFTSVNRSSQDGVVNTLRKQMFKETLQSAGSSSSRFPYQANPNTITPSFDARPEIELSPIPPSS